MLVVDLGTFGTNTAPPALLRERGSVMDRISVTTENNSQAAIVEVAGDIDLLTHDDFADKVAAALDGRHPVVVLDLSKVAFLGSAALSVLSSAAQKAAKSGVSLRLVAGDRVVLRPLEIVGMNKTLPVFDSVSAALASGSAGAAQD